MGEIEKLALLRFLWQLLIRQKREQITEEQSKSKVCVAGVQASTRLCVEGHWTLVCDL